MRAKTWVQQLNNLYIHFTALLPQNWPCCCYRASTQIHQWGRKRDDRRKRRGGRSYLRLHGPVHGGGLGGATIGERFRGAGRQRGLLGRRGSLRGALNVLTVPLVGLGWGKRTGQRWNKGQGKYFNDWNKRDHNQVEGNHFWSLK